VFAIAHAQEYFCVRHFHLNQHNQAVYTTMCQSIKLWYQYNQCPHQVPGGTYTQACSAWTQGIVGYPAHMLTPQQQQAVATHNAQTRQPTQDRVTDMQGMRTLATQREQVLTENSGVDTCPACTVPFGRSGAHNWG
jgi:hypothetical protein